MPRTVRIVLIALFVLGFIIRCYILRTRDIHYDEVIYYFISHTSSFLHIVTIEHAIKDHGILYFLVIKISQIFTLDIHVIRSLNLLLYTVSYWALVLFFIRRGAIVGSIISGLLFSFMSYFVYLYTFLTPYNFVLTLFLCSLFSLERFQGEKDYKKRRFFQAVFVIVTSGAWYANYSFVYAFYFYFFYYLFTYIFNRKEIKTLSVLYGITFISLIPGLLQMLHNFTYIVGSAQWLQERYSTLQQYILEVGTHIVFSGSSIAAVFILIAVVFTMISCNKKKSIEFRRLIYTLIPSFALILFSIYFINQFLIGIKLERTFWHPYILVICILSFSLDIFIKHFKKYGLFILLIFSALYIYGSYMKPQFSISGRVNDETKYLDFITSELTTKKDYTIYIYDPNTAHNYPLLMYYFSDLYPRQAYRGHEIQSFLVHNKIVFNTQRVVEFSRDNLVKAFQDPKAVIILFENSSAININQKGKATVYIHSYDENGQGYFRRSL